MAQTAARNVVEGQRLVDPNDRGLSEGQCVIGRWLVRHVGLDPGAGGVAFMPQDGYETFLEYQELNTKLDAAVDRFESLEWAQQRAWLEANFTKLRAGELELTGVP